MYVFVCMLFDERLWNASCCHFVLSKALHYQGGNPTCIINIFVCFHTDDVVFLCYLKFYYFSNMSLVVRKPVFRFLTRSDTNWVVQPLKMSRGIKNSDLGSRGIVLSV